MSDFKFDGHNPSTDLIASIAKLLDTHGIPNVMSCGAILSSTCTECLSSMMYVLFPHPPCCQSISSRETKLTDPSQDFCFVILDEHIDKACKVLLAANFPPCPLEDACPFVHPDCYPPTPYAHFNIYQNGELRDWFTLELHKKSYLLWAVPDFLLGAPALDDPDYMLVTDDHLLDYNLRLAMGWVPPTHYPVKVPTVARYAEALALLYYRDHSPKMTTHKTSWLTCQGYLSRNYLLDLDDLEPRICRHYKFWRAMAPCNRFFVIVPKLRRKWRRWMSCPLHPFPWKRKNRRVPEAEDGSSFDLYCCLSALLCDSSWCDSFKFVWDLSQ